MRHAKHSYSLNKSFSLRKALVISMAKNLLKFQRIKTTRNRAKATQQLVEKLITMGKEGSLAKKRLAYKILGDHKLVSLLFDDIAMRFKNRPGGFTRILSLGLRRGDDAKMVVFELTEINELKKKVKIEKEAKSEHLSEKISPEAEEKTKTELVVDEKITEKHPVQKKPAKKFLGGIRSIFKKERDSL